jgi:hypothetical protein
MPPYAICLTDHYGYLFDFKENKTYHDPRPFDLWHLCAEHKSWRSLRIPSLTVGRDGVL